MTVIATIVEGQGEELALRVLLQRLLAERFADLGHVEVERPHRLPRGRMVKPEHLGRAVELHRRRVQTAGAGGIVVLLDADDDDPVDLRERVRAAAEVEVEVVVAVREFEAWFLADAESLRTHRSVLPGAVHHPSPEGVRGAKEALSAAMHVPYRETLHQPAFCSLVDLEVVERRSASFASLVRALERILRPA